MTTPPFETTPFDPTIEQPSLVPLSSGPPAPPPVPSSKRARSFFWPGFAVAFVLLTLVSCGGLALGFGLTNLAALQQNGPVWTPPAYTATPEILAADTSNPAAPVGIFAIGETVRNITATRVNLRRTPGHVGKNGDDILAQTVSGESVVILDAPVQQDNLIWWPVRYTTRDGATLDGWMAEATASGVQILGR
jgi:hypothetical protein